MTAAPRLGRRLLRTALVASILTLATTSGLMAEGGSSRAVTDQALSILLLTTLPLAACVAVWGDNGGSDPLLAFGADRRRSTLARFSTYLWGLPLLSCLLAGLVLLWTRGPGDSHLPGDVAATLPVAFVAALSTGLAFLATNEWVGRAGLVVLLVAFVTLGQSEVALAIGLPGAHVRHLLGVGAALAFDPLWSMAALWGFSLLAFGAWIFRVPP